MSRDGHASDPFGRPCWCGDVHASECTCTGVGLRTKLATLTGRYGHSVGCPVSVSHTTEVSDPATSVVSVTLSRVPPPARQKRTTFGAVLTPTEEPR